jgi:hypothetical protein
MIIVRLAGGLGNQMFQYAVGFALADRYKVPLALDHSVLECCSENANYTVRDYELSVFGIDLRIDSADLPHLHEQEPDKGFLSGIIRCIVEKLVNGLRDKIEKKNYKVFQENPCILDYSFLDAGPNQYLSGYFQREEYFISVGKKIRQKFSFPFMDLLQKDTLVREIQANPNSVSIHVRRGDYLTPGDGKVHGACSPCYYSEAVKFIQLHIKKPSFYVFSADDPEWARDILHSFGINFRIINGEKTNAAKDMYMMHLCRHNIIANSSFSWWAAWLNPNPRKIVVAPKPWYFAKQYQSVTPVLPNWQVFNAFD